MSPVIIEYTSCIWKLRFVIVSLGLKPTSSRLIAMGLCLWTVAITDRGNTRFLRLRRNCSDTKTLKLQANVLKQRFLDKGYNQIEVEGELQKALETERSSLLMDKPQTDSNNSFK